MYRCIALALALGGLHTAALAQVQRNFPATALRGEIVVTAPPEITLNGSPSRLSPGSRIRGQDNMLLMSGAIVGQRLVVNYTTDLTGAVHDVWVLRPEEVRVRPWPRTAAQAADWRFDPVAQVWSRP
jgi:hypothetical protein